MSEDTEERDGYKEISYLQFEQGGATQVVMAILGVLTWPVTIPLALLSRASDIIFRTVSELFSCIPYFPGVILRYEFYRFALISCGKNVLVESGAVFIYPRVRIGKNVLIGRYSIIHECDIGDDVLIGERCTFLSGNRQHRYNRTDIPMNQQGGERKRIAVGKDCWIGSHCVVTEDVGEGSVIGAASVVTRPIPEYSVAVGSPAKVIRSRNDQS